MDPLSISASVLTLLGAGGSLSKLIKRAIDLKDAPRVLQDLEKDVADLRDLINDAEELLDAAVLSPGVRTPRSLFSSLKDIRSTLLALESYIENELTTTDSRHATKRLDKSVYFRTAETKLQGFRSDLDRRKLGLITALNLFASSSALETQTRGTKIMESLDVLQSTVKEHSGYVLRTLNILPDIGQGPDRYQELPVLLHGRQLRHREVEDVSSAVPSGARGGDQSTIKSTAVRRFQSSCNLDCNCSCHTYAHIRSPSAFGTLLGSFTLGIQPSTLWTRRCSDQRCRRRSGQATCTFALPSWLTKRIVMFTYSFTASKGPEFLLRVVNTRDLYYSVLARRSLEEVKWRLDRGEISVVDIDRRGFTLLEEMVRYWRIDIVCLLLSYGADFHQTNPSASDPSFSAFKFAYSSLHGRENVCDPLSMRLRELVFRDISQFQVFGFTSLHKAYLGLNGQTFDSTLARTERSNIDKTDSRGRTTLHWAAKIGDSSAVQQLLVCGADPNVKDNGGCTALHSATYSADVEACSLLLSAGADINAQDKGGEGPLYRAIYSDNCNVLQLLIDRTDLETQIKTNYGIGLFACIACFSRIPAMRIVSQSGLQFSFDEDYEADRADALYCAQYRRDSNEDWAYKTRRPQDKDPQAWYDAFMDFLDTIEGKQRISEIEDGDDDASENEDEAEEEDEDEDDSQNWQDAVEHPQDSAPPTEQVHNTL